MEVKLIWSFFFLLFNYWKCAYGDLPTELAEASIERISISQQDPVDHTRRLDVFCYQDAYTNLPQDVIYHSYMVKEVVFHKCPPTVSCAKILSMLNVTLTSVKVLTLENIPNIPINNGCFKGLIYLKKLEIIGKKERPFTPSEQYLDDLSPRLRELRMSYVSNMPPLPLKTLKSVYLSHGSSSSFLLESCKQLRVVELKDWTGAIDWRHCQRLSTVKLLEMTDYNKLMDVLSGLPSSVVRLTIMNSALRLLSTLPDKLNLKKLYVQGCPLQKITGDFLNNVSNTLQDLELSYNYSPINYPLFDMYFPQLVSMNLTYSGEQNFCNKFKADKFPRLKRLSLRSNRMTRMCFAAANNLTELDLSDNDIGTLELNQLPLNAEREYTLAVLLTGNPLTTISPFTENMYRSMERAFEHAPDLYGSLLSLETDKELRCLGQQWLEKAVNNKFLSVNFPCSSEDIRHDDGRTREKEPTANGVANRHEGDTDPSQTDVTENTHTQPRNGPQIKKKSRNLQLTNFGKKNSRTREKEPTANGEAIRHEGDTDPPQTDVTENTHTQPRNGPQINKTSINHQLTNLDKKDSSTRQNELTANRVPNCHQQDSYPSQTYLPENTNEEPRNGPTKYVANKGFVGKGSIELTFMTGDVFVVTNFQPGYDWFIARKEGTNKKGFVPKSYLCPVSDPNRRNCKYL